MRGVRMSSADRLRVLVADDHPLLRDGLRRSLEAFGVCVVADVGDGRQAVAATEQHRPDLVLMDLWMPLMDGIRATEIIRARHPDVVVVILTFDTTESLHDRAIEAGAAGVITKDTAAEDLAEAVTALAAGMPTSSARSADDEMRGGELSLTARELEVLDLIVKGASTTSIASSLYISAKTVKNHLASIYEKLDVRDRTQAVLYALRLGLVSLDRPHAAAS